MFYVKLYSTYFFFNYTLFGLKKYTKSFSFAVVLSFKHFYWAVIGRLE